MDYRLECRSSAVARTRTAQSPLQVPSAGHEYCGIGSCHRLDEENVMAPIPNLDCIEACNHCANLCDFCASACLKEVDVAAMGPCIALAVDCAALCRLAAGFMARASKQSATLRAACAAVCNACADECARHDAGHCRRCAEACSACAQICREMADGATQGAPAAAQRRTQPALRA
jgi:hypothetical protein